MTEKIASFVLCIAMLAGTVAVSGAPIGSTEAARRYNYAGRLYREGAYADALGGYQQLIDEGIHHPDLYYNASNAAYRAGDLGTAVLYIERALRLDPGDADALANRAFLMNLNADQEASPDAPLLAVLSRWYAGIHINAAAWWSGMMFLLACCVATATIFAGERMRIAGILACGILLTAFVASTGVLAQKLHAQATTVEAVIMTAEAPAYSGPGEDNTHIFTLHEGAVVYIERSQDGWALLRLPSGAGGWISEDRMREI